MNHIKIFNADSRAERQQDTGGRLPLEGAVARSVLRQRVAEQRHIEQEKIRPGAQLSSTTIILLIV